ncbi:MAG: FAD-binding oxidoreductase, partial [Dehalococcoidia bacterium]
MTAHDLAATLRDVGNLTVLDTVAAYAVDGRRPAVVVRPHDSASVCTLLRHCATWELAVIPCGGRTDIALGNAPEAYQVALDMTTLDRIVEHRPRDLSVTVEAGMTFAALDQALAPHGQIVGLDPPCPERATVGGVLAANASGPRRHRFGTARDHVIGISAVLANGDQVKSGGRVVKNVAGYDLAKLFIGSA